MREETTVVVREILEREITDPFDGFGRREILDFVTDDYMSEGIVLTADDIVETEIFIKNYENLKVVFQDGDRTLLNRGTSFEPWVVVTDFNPSTQSWWYGNYFSDFYDAVEYMKEKCKK